MAATSAESQSSLSLTGLRDTIAGAVGGVVCTYVGHPFDTVKVRMQTTGATRPLATGIEILKNEGLRGIFAGVTPSVAAQVTENAILFMAYGYCQKAVMWATNTPRNEDLSLLSLAGCGSLASAFAALGLTPTELVKCRLQVNRIAAQQEGMVHVTYKGPLDCAMQILRAEGIQGLYRGLSSTLLRELPGNFAMFGGYECVKWLLCPEGTNPDDMSVARLVVSGALGGASFWIVAYPLDVIKSRVQVSEQKVEIGGLVKQILKTEGPRAFYRGFTPCVLRAFPANGSLFATVEVTKKLIDSVTAK
jgi:solute carrier family 25 ornithine transporter 2/15